MLVFSRVSALLFLMGGLLFPGLGFGQNPPTVRVGKPRLAPMLQNLRVLAQQYSQAQKDGKIVRWEAYHRSQEELRQAQAQWKSLEGLLKTSQPSIVSLVAAALAQLQKAIQDRAPVHVIGQTAYKLLADLQEVHPLRKTQEIAPIHATSQMLNQQLVAEEITGGYRVGLFLRQPRTLYQLQEVGRHDQRVIPIRPGHPSQIMLGILLRDQTSGDLLSGTDVSLEVLHPQSRKQLSTQKAILVWDSYPFYAVHLSVPSLSEVLLQITVSPFPVTRTQKALQSLRSGGVVQLKAKIVNGGLEFPPSSVASYRPKAAQGGLAYLRALQAVGGQTIEDSVYRAGIGLIAPEDLYTWQSGSLTKEPPYYRTNGQLVVFLQDLRTGALVPQMRVTVFLYWRESYGLYRASFKLKPVYDGFYGYRLPVSIPLRSFEKVSIQFDSPVIATFRPRPQANFLMESENFHATLLPRPPLRRRTK